MNRSTPSCSSNSALHLSWLTHLDEGRGGVLSVSLARCAWALTLVMVAGCSHPSFNPQSLGVAIPERWSAPGRMPEGTLPTSWLNTFRDPTLKALVEEALAHNYDLQATAARLKIAQVQAAIAGAERQPLVDLRPRLSRTQINVAGPEGEPVSVTSSNIDLPLDLSWELDVWGRIRAGQRAAEEEAEAAEADLLGAAPITRGAHRPGVV